MDQSNNALFQSLCKIGLKYGITIYIVVCTSAYFYHLQLHIKFILE